MASPSPRAVASLAATSRQETARTRVLRRRRGKVRRKPGGFVGAGFPSFPAGKCGNRSPRSHNLLEFLGAVAADYLALTAWEVLGKRPLQELENLSEVLSLVNV